MRGLLSAVPFGRLAIVFQAVAAALFVAYLLHGDGVRVPLLSQIESVEVAFDDGAGLSAEDHPRVTIAGVRVGEVGRVRYAGGRAIAELELEPSARERLRADAGALIVPRSALNDLTVELQPGTARTPLAGERPIEADPSAAPVSLDRVLETLDADTRAQVQILFGELATGLEGRATPLRSALADLGATAGSTARVADALADRRRLLTRLVGELDTVFATLGERGQNLGDLVSAGRTTLAATTAREAELAGAMRELPRTLAGVETALAQTRALAGELEPALVDLRPFAGRLPASLRSLREFVPTARGLVDDLDDLARDGAAPARDLRAGFERLGPASQALKPSVDDLLSVLREIDRNKAGIPLLGERFSGVFSTQDANGPILRGLGFFEAFAPSQLGFEAGLRGKGLERAKRLAVKALVKACLEDRNGAACLARYLIPGLPGAVRQSGDPLGSARLARRPAK